MASKKSDYLNSVLETHRMAHIDALLTKYKNKRADVKEALEEYYTSNIYSPLNSGSYAKSTAINSKFDLDIVIPFKRNSFDTLEKLFDDIYIFLYDKYRNEATVRKQKVSIGIEFYSDEDNDIISLDIVPGRELNQGQYIDDKNLNLFVNSKYGTIDEKTHIQTNINAQIEHIKAKVDERKIIRLFKIWKHMNYEPYKSFFFELITIKAFDKTEITGDLWDKLKAVMEYIKDNVSKDSFKLTDPGNSNNDVMETLDSLGKTNLSNRMSTIIKRIEENDENIKSYFPVNEEFDEEKSSNNSYGIKGSVVLPSIPKNDQRFG